MRYEEDTETRMDCTECDYTTTNDFNYCPDCGSELEERTLDDFDFPLYVDTTIRKNLHRLVEDETGLDLRESCFYDDQAIPITLQVLRDGSAELVDTEVTPEVTGDVKGVHTPEHSTVPVVSYQCPFCDEVNRRSAHREYNCEECGSNLELTVVPKQS